MWMKSEVSQLQAGHSYAKGLSCYTVNLSSSSIACAEETG